MRAEHENNTATEARCVSSVVDRAPVKHVAAPLTTLSDHTTPTHEQPHGRTRADVCNCVCACAVCCVQTPWRRGEGGGALRRTAGKRRGCRACCEGRQQERGRVICCPNGNTTCEQTFFNGSPPGPEYFFFAAPNCCTTAVRLQKMIRDEKASSSRERTGDGET